MALASKLDQLERLPLTASHLLYSANSLSVRCLQDYSISLLSLDSVCKRAQYSCYIHVWFKPKQKQGGLELGGKDYSIQPWHRFQYEWSLGSTASSRIQKFSWTQCSDPRGLHCGVLLLRPQVQRFSGEKRCLFWTCEVVWNLSLGKYIYWENHHHHHHHPK